MATVVISPAFQVRLPKSAREALQLGPGQRLRVVQYADRLELVPLRPALEGAALFGEPPDPGLRSYGSPGDEMPVGSRSDSLEPRNAAGPAAARRLRKGMPP